MPNLNRFHQAQQKSRDGYAQAYNEILSGKKRNHWIWYILPQLKTLGRSDNAITYGIADFNEACEYLHDPILFKRYHDLVKLIEQQLVRNPHLLIDDLMGSSVDAGKLASSLTLFHGVALSLDAREPKQELKDLKKSCTAILGIMTAQGYRPCPNTLVYLQNQSLRTPVNHPLPVGTNIARPHQRPPITLFEPRTPPIVIPVNTEDTPRVISPLTQKLAQFKKDRENEWAFHYNFLGVVAVVYFILDFIYGTDYFDSKSREIKLSAATKLMDKIDPEKMEQTLLFSPEEEHALNDGRLGKIVAEEGGLEYILQNAREHDTGTRNMDLNP